MSRKFYQLTTPYDKFATPNRFKKLGEFFVHVDETFYVKVNSPQSKFFKQIKSFKK